MTDAALASLFWLIGLANFMLDQPAGILAGISALIVGTCAASTTCIFIALGGWQTEKDERRHTRESR